jgi:hypothetical protein
MGEQRRLQSPCGSYKFISDHTTDESNKEVKVLEVGRG